MADAGIVARFFSEFTPTTWSVIVLIAMAVVAAVKVWPLIKGKINEARKIELDAEADLRGDLLGRIDKLETSRDGEQGRIEAAIASERRRCDAELAQRDAALSETKLEFNRRIDQLMRVIAQNSQSSAFLLDEKGQLGKPRRRKTEEPKK